MVAPRCAAFALAALALPAAAVPSEHKRDILGLLRGDDDDTTSTVSTRVVFATTSKFTTTSTSSSANPSPSTSPSVSHQWTPTAISRTDTVVSTTIDTSLASTPPILPASVESQASIHSSKTWQIIGIVIISVLFIATSITCAMFFDRLWRFLKDVIRCTSHPPASEEFIPDCEIQNWDTRSLCSSPSGFNHDKGESLREKPSTYTRARELPWNTDAQHWNALHRQPSRKHNYSPAT